MGARGVPGLGARSMAVDTHGASMLLGVRDRVEVGTHAWLVAKTPIEMDMNGTKRMVCAKVGDLARCVGRTRLRNK